MWDKLRDDYNKVASATSEFLGPLSDLSLRLIVAKVFLTSGLGKWAGWFDFDEQKYDLFLYEFFCPDPVRPGALLLCDAETLDYAEGTAMIEIVESMAMFAGVMEVLLPVLLIVGFGTRIGALGLLAMTLFIQLAVFPTWEHWLNPASWWAVVLLAIVARGPGFFSLDRLLRLDG